MRSTPLVSSALAFLLLLLSPAAASATEDYAVRIEAFDLEDPFLTVVVSVYDAEGEQVLDLGKDSFDVSIDGVSTRLASAELFEDSDVGFATLMLIDTSCSIRRSLDDVKAAARSYVDGMKGGDVAIIGQFHDEVEGLHQGWSSDVGKLNGEIDALEVPTGNRYTVLYEALTRGIDEKAGLDNAPPFRGVLVLSDGKDDPNKRTKAECCLTIEPCCYTDKGTREAARDHETPISAVGFVPGRDDETASLKSLALGTGGRYSHATSSADLKQRFQDVQTSIHQLWVLEIETAPMLPGSHPLEVKIDEGSHAGSTARSFTVEGQWKGEEKLEPIWTNPLVLALVGGAGMLLMLTLLLFLRMMAKHKRDEMEARIDQASAEARSARMAQEQAEYQAQQAEQQAVSAQQQAMEALDAARVAQSSAASAADVAEASARRAPQVVVQQAPAAPKKRRGTMYRDPSEARVALVVSEGEEAGREYVLTDFGQSVRVGSDSGRVECVVAHQTVSGHHADIVMIGDGSISITDVGSSNGTYVGGQDIRGLGPTAVGPGGQVQLGLLKLVVKVG